MQAKKKALALTLVSLLALGTLGGCSSGGEKKIMFADVGWDSIRFHNAVAGTVAEAVFGYDGWEEVTGTTPLTHEAVKRGEIDVHMETWTDNLPDYAKDLEAGLLTEWGVNFDDNAQGLYVPRYVIEGDAARGIEPMAPNFKTVKDLKDYAGLFRDPEDPNKGLLYSGIAGWGATEILHNKYLLYGLDEMYNYIEPGTDAATSAVLVAAYDKGEPIVAYYWEPTWLLGQYDFVLLEDEPYDEAVYLDGGCAYPSVRITICTSNDFAKKDPAFCEFLSKYHTSSTLASEALAHMEQTGDDYAETAEWFIRERRDLLEQWLTPAQVELLYAEIG